MADLPRKQREYFEQIKKALGQNDPEMLGDLVRNKTPLATREDLSNILGEHVNQNYNDPLNIFENKKILEDVPVNYTEQLPENVTGEYIKDHGIYLRKNDINKVDNQLGRKLHEYGHANDDLVKGFESNPYIKTKALGLEAAEKAFSDHHASGFFEKEALMDLLKNKKLKMIAPLAIGASLMGATDKAIAGDIPGAALETGSIIDPTGISGAALEVRDRLQHPERQKEYAKEDYLRALPPGLDLEEQSIQDTEEIPDDKFSQIKQRLNK